MTEPWPGHAMTWQMRSSCLIMKLYTKKENLVHSVGVSLDSFPIGWPMPFLKVKILW